MRLIVEPHADDAFLSLGGTLLRWKKEGIKFSIVTVFAHRKRAEEAALFAEKVGAVSHCIVCPETTDLETTASFPVKEVVKTVRDAILERIHSLEVHDVYVPVGIQHPEHKLVAGVIRGMAIAGAMVHRYLEIPYYTKLKNQAYVDEALARYLHIESCMRPSAAKWAMVEIFKTQSKFFHFNAAADLRNIPEIILRDPR